MESSDRVGGRTLTHFHNKHEGDDGETDTFDLGAHWVSKSQPRIMKLMEELGIGYYQQNVKGRKVLQVGDDKVRTYKSDIPNLNSYAALIKMNSLINKYDL